LKHKRLVVLSILIAGLGVGRNSALHAESPLFWTLEANAGIALGHTTYLLDAPDPAAVGVRSELVFPLETLTASLRASMGRAEGPKRDWRVQLYLATALSDPWGLMKDSDWYLLQGYPPIPFSYTESDVELRTLTAGPGQCFRGDE
jgi:hypothetical protein